MERAVFFLLYVAQDAAIRRQDVAERFGVSTRAVNRDIKNLRGRGLVVYKGSAKTGRYELTDDGRRVLAQLLGQAKKPDAAQEE